MVGGEPALMAKSLHLGVTLVSWNRTAATASLNVIKSISCNWERL